MNCAPNTYGGRCACRAEIAEIEMFGSAEIVNATMNPHPAFAPFSPNATDTSMTKTLICLGGNVEAVPIIERAIALGHRAVVVDGDARCPGRSLTDDFVHASCYHGDRADRKSVV